MRTSVLTLGTHLTKRTQENGHGEQTQPKRTINGETTRYSSTKKPKIITLIEGDCHRVGLIKKMAHNLSICHP